MYKRKYIKIFNYLLRKIFKLQKRLLQAIYSFLRSFFIGSWRQRRQRQAGFVLPTVTMVLLVVVLLTITLTLRSFDRAKNASNVRVDQVVLNAAAPAIDRAKAKIQDVLAKLAGRIPSDNDLYTYINNNTYTLGDETRLELVFDINKNGTIQKLPGDLVNDETLNSAWKFPADTDNNGKFDSYTIYGIYYRSPSRDTTTGNFNRARNPLEARTPPMSGGKIGSLCASATGTSASFVGSSSWYKTGGNLTKSFFIYTAAIPITNPPTNPPVGNANQYEKYIGNKGFSALELQQDYARIPLNNNAVVFEDDMEITPGPAYRLNGRIITNSNLLAGRVNGQVDLYQVSSQFSCYYQEENSRIVVGGNVANGGLYSPFANPVNVHLFKGVGNNPDTSQQISSTNQSTTNNSQFPPAIAVSYNSQAYAQRIARLVAAQLANPSTTDPSAVQSQVNAAPTSQQTQIRQTQLQTYFRNVTRRVPSLEVPYGGDALGIYATSNPLQQDKDGNGNILVNTLRPIDAWIYPTNPSNGTDSTGYTGLPLNTNQMQATEPQQQKQSGTEQYLGDRIQVGNNLPALWFNKGAFNGANAQQNLSNVTWTGSSVTRYRQTRVQALADLGITDRDGFWEQAAATKPTTPLDNNGGMRVITGAGVYERRNSFLPPPTYDDPTTSAIERYPTYGGTAAAPASGFPMVWPDSMPMSPGSQVFDNAAATPQWAALPTLPLTLINSIPAIPTIDLNTPKYAKGDLRMRATAVYHYATSAYNPNTPNPPTTPANYQTPIACVSSYYDPTNSSTARNPIGLADVSGVENGTNGTQPIAGVAKSNNGIAYKAPTTTASSLTGVSPPNAAGLFPGDENSTTLLGRLYYQANLKFPNGRFVNQPLYTALNALGNNQILTLAQQSAIDSNICALQILDGTLSPSTAFIPNGAIEEITFLNSRQIKAIESDNPATNAVETFTNDGDASLTDQYNLPVEERQPLEIRATVLDMGKLAAQTIAGTNVKASSEYLLPNSGIIYASRDDALPDLSDKSANSNLLSPTDFKHDPTTRPQSILLTNGKNLSRSANFQAAEKGLILATSLPVYVNGDFNLHSGQEFLNNLASDWGNFYNRTANQLNPNFACRQGDPRLPNCTNGDQWRSATVLADAVTLLSNTFQFGFRNDGDYDLRNNDGNQDSINKRLKNGFWNNNFVTSRNFQDSTYSGNGGNSTNDSSYFNNFVTPIQRRVYFPEYVMEICRKLPVSECQPSDWVVTIGGLDQQASSVPIGTLANLLQTGTTATPATNPADQRYARRVAFARNSYGELQLTQGTNAITAKPIGIDNNGKVALFPYGNNAISTPVPRFTSNALWFRTTNLTAGDPGAQTDITYDNSKPLYYLPPNQGGTKLILPNTPEIPGIDTLNGSGPNDPNAPSNFTMCLTAGSGGYSQQYLVTGLTGSCPNLINLNPQVGELLSLPSLGTLSNNSQTLNAISTSNINVYQLYGGNPDINFGATITLNGNADSIFIFQGTRSVQLGKNGPGAGITIKLQGVNPNNVFWVSNGSLTIADATAAQPHQLVGNFIGKTSLKIGAYTQVLGGRFLNYNTIPGPGGIPSTAQIYAITTDGQPGLVPVLQIQSTDGAPPSDPNAGNTSLARSTRWMMPAAQTTFNLAAAAGDTPSRANTNLSESNGGLYNFVRFLENWNDYTPANISGSFIQLKRSAYDTQPWRSVIAGPATGGNFNYMQGYKDGYGLLGNGWGYLPYYVAPVRNWGFDVALLSQSPDLFAQKLTLAPTSPPNEFFREVGRDDSWIQALLCATQQDKTTGNYSSYAVDTDQHPSCSFTPPYP